MKIILLTMISDPPHNAEDNRIHGTEEVYKLSEEGYTINRVVPMDKDFLIVFMEK